MTFPRSIRVLAAGLLIAAASAAAAQDNGQVGPAELQRFQLRGQPERPAPPPAEPTIAPLPAPPVQTAPPVEATPSPEAVVVPTLDEATIEPAPPVATTRRARTPAAPVASRIDDPAPAAEAPAAAPVTTIARTPERDPVEAPAPAVDTAPAASDTRWLWLLAGAGALAALATAAALHARRQRRQAEEDGWTRDEPAVAGTAESVPVPDPAMPPPAAPAGVAERRPWIELAFKPARASATDIQATVHYELTVRNTGEAPAQALMLRSCMFSAGATEDGELADFCTAAIPGEYLIDPIDLDAGAHAVLHAVATLPRDQVKEVTVQGRRLFIPLVAFSAHYSWDGNRHGHTAASFLVGREPAAAEGGGKMAPFRLDQGPRVYAAVGQRPGQLAAMS